MTRPGHVALDGIMHRCGLLATLGYSFFGVVDLARLKESFLRVTSNVERFKYELYLDERGAHQWARRTVGAPVIRVVASDEPRTDFTSLCQDSWSHRDALQGAPLFWTVFCGTPNERGERVYLIAQTMDHAYCDGASLETILDRVIEHYNALLTDDGPAARYVEDAVRGLYSPSTDDLHRLFRSSSLIRLSAGRHARNILGISRYPLADNGSHGSPFAAVRRTFSTYRNRKHRPLMRTYPLRSLLAEVRSKTPTVSTNSVICAVIVKSLHQINCRTKRMVPEHTISFRLVVDVLPPELREHVIGNYIAYVPITVSGLPSIAEIARDIHRRIQAAKRDQEHVSQFKLLEFAISNGMVGKKDDPVSCCITFMRSRRFADAPGRLQGTTYQDLVIGVQTQPLDVFGGLMSNKPTIAVALDAQDNLFLTIFPRPAPEAQDFAIIQSVSDIVTNTYTPFHDRASRSGGFDYPDRSSQYPDREYRPTS